MELARDDQLLLVATGKFSGTHRKFSGTNIILLHCKSRGRRNIAKVQNPGTIKFWASMQPEHKIFGQRSIQKQSFVVAIFRNNANTKPANLPGRPVTDVPSQEAHYSRAPAILIAGMKHGL